MRNKVFYLTILFSGLLSKTNILAQKLPRLEISETIDLPLNEKFRKQPGLAGPFTGKLGNKIIIAGGANFPDKLPWNGGKKFYWSDIYVYHIENDTISYWEKSLASGKMQENIAYGASVQLENSLLFIGGENENGISKKVFLLRNSDTDGKISIENIADLPIPLTNLSASVIGETVYVAGGENVDGVSNKLFKIELSAKKTTWQELAPLPISASHGVLLASGTGVATNLFFIGGRKKNANGISEFYSTTFEYIVSQNKWVKKEDLPYKVAAGFGISEGKHMLYYFGGDTGETFNKVEALITAIEKEKDTALKQQLLKEKNLLQENHPGFVRNILQYDVMKNKWKIVSMLDSEMPVTTSIVHCFKKYYIPSGEIKAGIRSPKILVIDKLK